MYLPLVPSHVVIDHDAFDRVIGIGTLVLSLVAVSVALWAQRSVGKERRRIFELGILTRIIEPYSTGQANYQGDDVVSRRVETLHERDLPTLRAWLKESKQASDENVRASIAAEYSEAVRRRL